MNAPTKEYKSVRTLFAPQAATFRQQREESRAIAADIFGQPQEHIREAWFHLNAALQYYLSIDEQRGARHVQELLTKL